MNFEQAAADAFVTSESCGPDKDYTLVFRFKSLDDLQTAHRAWVTRAAPAPAGLAAEREGLTDEQIAAFDLLLEDYVMARVETAVQNVTQRGGSVRMPRPRYKTLLEYLRRLTAEFSDRALATSPVSEGKPT